MSTQDIQRKVKVAIPIVNKKALRMVAKGEALCANRT